MDVGGWLRSLGLGQYEALFRASEIDADILPELTEIDLEKLGVPLGHRKRCVMNDLDRFHLVGDVIDRVPKLGARAAYAKQAIRDKLIDHREYISRYGDDMPEIVGWRWGQEAASAGVPSTEADNV
jgi:hypothetical protein